MRLTRVAPATTEALRARVENGGLLLSRVLKMGILCVVEGRTLICFHREILYFRMLKLMLSG